MPLSLAAAPRLLHVFSNFVASGPELRTVALMNAFGGRYRHVVVSMDGRTSALPYVDSAVHLDVCHIDPVGGPLGTARALATLYDRVRPDLLLTYNWGAFDAVMAAVATRRRPLVHHEDGFNVDEAVRLKRRRTWARRLFLRSVKAVVVPSATLERIARSQWGLSPPRLRFIPNGVMSDRLSPGIPSRELRERLGIPRAAVVLGTVAHLRREKRLDRLLDLLCHVRSDRQLHIVVVGEGSERGALESQARERGVADRLHLVGAQRAVGDFLHCFDGYLLTSDTEQMPVSLLEAMCCGLPVVATRVGDVDAMLPDVQRSLTVAIGSAEDTVRGLADAVQTLIQDRELAERLGRANRDHVARHYSFDAMAHQYADVYERAVTS